ncbi:MAG TPA: 50S ribosomal protein L17 [Candidatus Polarisedimenticolia bacterium]|jgi:large subunit ribosomal protein L17|nr:50S ribosomal protein L17 [Candidatus Polarisedimenticolia bacterium]
MRHGVRLRKLGRTSSHRMALLRSLSTSLFRHERIRTTLPKAKELRPFAERLITMARKDDLHARRQVVRQIADRDVVKKLFSTLGPRFATRPGGYTRTMRLGPRQGDGAEMALVELVGSEGLFKKQREERLAKKDRRDAAKKKREDEQTPPPEATGESNPPPAARA